MPGRSFVSSSSYKYGFNGKEKDDEINGNGNSYDFGARQNDPRLGKWWSVDPEFKRYPHFSPYVAFGNNPNYYIDPGGETLRVAGDAAARAQAQTALQKLTNDKVTVMDNGIVKIVKGNENPDKKLVFGTQLLKAVSTNNQTASITITDGENSTSADEDKRLSGTPQDAAVSWNPNSMDGGVNTTGGTSRPPAIGLAHELGHALYAMLGIATDDENQLFGDPDESGQDANFGVEEVNVRLMENEIRKEQGEPLRLIPKGVDRTTGKDIDTSKPLPTPAPTKVKSTKAPQDNAIPMKKK